MATEGLLAVSCRHGTLHLCEDVMHFELPQVGDDPDLRAVIISDFSRQTQIMARYQMNDLVRLQPEGCPCGSPLTAVSAVVGRVDDCFFLGAERVLLTPDVIRNAVVDSDRGITDFRVVQTGSAQVRVQVDTGKEAAQAALRALFAGRGVDVEVVVEDGAPTPCMDRKLRRVENRFAR